ncbi:MAG TPA: hypothetical protein VJS12_06920 [Steroidobacteraceae bacterium]|nr:hypothetical protein [Steroidobacteraceae bacterium]
MHSALRACPLLLLVLSGCQAFVGQSATHAQLTEGPESIESLLRLPSGLEAGRYVVQCEALVDRTGRARRFTCYTAHRDQHALARQVRLAGRRAQFVPATRDGAKAEVYMLVMVQIDTTQSEPLILAVPNNGVEAGRYGLLYSAPQRFNEFTWDSRDWSGSGHVLLWQNLHIDEHGKVLECAINNVSGAPEWLVARIKAQTKRMAFMPGYFQGKPVAMLYIEPVYD